jgi:hypothetical protein
LGRRAHRRLPRGAARSVPVTRNLISKLSFPNLETTRISAFGLNCFESDSTIVRPLTIQARGLIHASNLFGVRHDRIADHDVQTRASLPAVFPAHAFSLGSTSSVRCPDQLSFFFPAPPFFWNSIFEATFFS